MSQESQGPGRASRRAKAERDAEDPEGEVRDQLGKCFAVSVVSPVPSFSRSAAFEKRCGEPNVRRQIVLQWYMSIPVPLTSSMGATMLQEVSMVVSP